MNKKAIVCPANDLLQVLSQQHILIIIKTLSDNILGFNTLQQITNINSRTLSIKLQILRENMIIRSINCKEDKRRSYYELTSKGKKINTLLKKLELLA